MQPALSLGLAYDANYQLKLMFRIYDVSVLSFCFVAITLPAHSPFL